MGGSEGRYRGRDREHATGMTTEHGEGVADEEVESRPFLGRGATEDAV